MKKVNFGNFVLGLWLVFGIYAGMLILESNGELIGSLFSLYMVVWVSVVFFGRFAIEWIINKLWVTKDKT